jgi:hypothetical protein
MRVKSDTSVPKYNTLLHQHFPVAACPVQNWVPYKMILCLPLDKIYIEIFALVDVQYTFVYVKHISVYPTTMVWGRGECENSN